MSHDVPRILLALLLTTASVCGDVLSQWNFNSPTPDANSATGSSEPSMGSGIALAIGGATTSFAAATSETPDPATSDNTAWNIANFPRIMEGNLTAGVQFNVSTRGYESIVISWGEMHSASASRYVRPQYTLDGIHYINLPSCTVLQAGQWTNFVASLAHVPGAVDNPDFGFRIVAEQEITAISNGYYTAYMPSSTNSTYAETGIIRLDMFTVSGQPISDGNTPPVLISAIGTQSLRGFQSTAPLAFTVLDAEEPATSIVLQKSSSNPAVMPLENITLTGTGATRTVTLRGADVSGSSDVRITAIDGGGKSSFFTINVTVVPQNSSPVLTVPRLMYSTAGLAPCVGSITVQDEETAGALLSFEIRGEGWLPDSALAVTASGTNRTIQITPPAAQAGIVRLHAEASDGTNSTSAVFPFMLLPFEGLYVYEPFNYPDGSAVTNSGFYWQTRSGLEREAQTTNGWLRLSEKSTEDLTAPLAGGPVTTNEGNVVYASFKIRCTSLPDIMPDYFFHLQSGSSLIGRVFLGKTNAVEGLYRLYVANGSKGIPVDFPMSLNKGTVYTAVLRYSTHDAISTLWVNPVHEDSPSVTARDALNPPLPVTAVGFRQSDGLGPEVWIDELKVGSSFRAVTAPVTPAPYLRYEQTPAGLELRWNQGESLQRASSAAGPFEDVTGAQSPFRVEPSMSGTAAFFRLKMKTDLPGSLSGL